jgi:hypothetical protein
MMAFAYSANQRKWRRKNMKPRNGIYTFTLLVMAFYSWIAVIPANA